MVHPAATFGPVGLNDGTTGSDTLNGSLATTVLDAAGVNGALAVPGGDFVLRAD